MRQNLNVAADNDSSHCRSAPAITGSSVQTLLSRPLAAFMLRLADNNAINQKL